MRTFASRATAALIAAGVTVSTAALLAEPAGAAAPPAALSFLPAKGLASTPMYVVMPAPCPAGGTNVVAKAFGHGFPAAGQPVVTNSTAGVSHNAPFILPLQDSFVGFAADNGTTLSGPYRVTLRCINRLANKTYASYSATVSFSDTAHFTAPAPAPALIAAIQASEQPVQPAPSGSAKAKGSGPAAGKSTQPQASAAAGGTGSNAGGAGTGSNAGLAPAANASIQSKSGFPWQPTLIVAAFVLIGLAILLRIREVRGANRRARARLQTRSTPSATASCDPPPAPPTLTGSASANNHAKGHHS
jgi:hypothetical protein